MGLYSGLYIIIKIIGSVGGKKKVPTIASVPAETTAGGEIPSSDSPVFGEWVSQNGNIEKLLESL